MFTQKNIRSTRFKIGLVFFLISVLIIILTTKSTVLGQDKKLILKIQNLLGDIKVVDSKQVVNLNFKVQTSGKIEDYPKNEITEKKITETILTDANSNAGEKLLVIFNKVKRTAQQGEESAKEFTDASEGTKLILTGEKLFSYRKSQPDSGLIFPEYSIESGDSWQIQKSEKEKYFLEIYKNENLDVKFTWLKIDSASEESKRIAVIERDLIRIGNQGDLTITQKTKTLFYVDIQLSKIMRIESAGTIDLKGDAKTGEKVVAFGSITEKISYSYARTAMYMLQPKYENGCTQTEMTNVSIQIKLLVTPKAQPEQKFTMTEIHETEKVIRRKNLDVIDNKIKKYSVVYNHYKATINKQNSFNKAEIERSKSSLEGKTYIIELDDSNKIKVQGDNDTDAKIVEELENKCYQHQFPSFAVPVGYSWQIKADTAKAQFQELFTDLTIESAVAQVDFEQLEKNAKDEQIAVLSLNFGVIGENKDRLKIKFVVRILNYFNITKGQITKICTDPKLKDETLMKISYEDEKTIVEGYGNIEINTEFSYTSESTNNTSENSEYSGKILGDWEYSDADSKQHKKHLIQFNKDGEFIYKHPHLLRDEQITETGTWVLKDKVLTIIINEKTDVFEVAFEDNALILKRIEATKNPSSIYPWIIDSTAKYLRTS